MGDESNNTVHGYWYPHKAKASTADAPREVSHDLESRGSFRFGIMLVAASIIIVTAAVLFYQAGAPGIPKLPTPIDQGKIRAFFPADAEKMTLTISYSLDTNGYGTRLNLGAKDDSTYSRWAREKAEDIAVTPGIIDTGFADAPSVKELDPGYVAKQEGLQRTIAVFQLSGGTRIDPATIQLPPADGAGTLSSRFYDQGTQYQYIAVDETAFDFVGKNQSPDVLSSLFFRNFQLSAHTIDPYLSRDNARTLAKGPPISAPSLCPEKAGTKFFQNVMDSASTNICVDRSNPDLKQLFQLPQPGAVRIDYSNVPPTTPGVPSWDVAGSTEGIQASYVDLSEEANDSRQLFISAALIGVGTTLAPLGLEKLSPALREFRARLRQRWARSR